MLELVGRSTPAGVLTSESGVAVTAEVETCGSAPQLVDESAAKDRRMTVIAAESEA